MQFIQTRAYERKCKRKRKLARERKRARVKRKILRAPLKDTRKRTLKGLRLRLRISTRRVIGGGRTRSQYWRDARPALSCSGKHADVHFLMSAACPLRQCAVLWFGVVVSRIRAREPRHDDRIETVASVIGIPELCVPQSALICSSEYCNPGQRSTNNFPPLLQFWKEAVAWFKGEALLTCLPKVVSGNCNVIVGAVSFAGESALGYFGSFLPHDVLHPGTPVHLRLFVARAATTGSLYPSSHESRDMVSATTRNS
ncbi:hypothetical protein EDD85DRAFT_784206 [Armillaria nabsnona]|nr:hypothetical protein EDD85DRAFT_784206 [Armillaria nabsnona]